MISKETVDTIRKTVVFLGRRDDNHQPLFFATGFIVAIKKVLHLVTAKHTIFSQRNGKFMDEGVFAFLNSNSGQIVPHSITCIKRDLNVDWVFHRDKQVDLAIIPFPIDPENEIVKSVPDDLFLPEAYKLHEVLDIFFLSFQPGTEDYRKISPIVRTGTISLMNYDKTFYIDAATFPGNSGSPVFTKPGDFISGPGDHLRTMARINFIGVVGGYIPYTEKAISNQTGHVRVVFEENTGLSKVWSVSFINEISSLKNLWIR